VIFLIEGNALKFGDNIDTDIIMPTEFLTLETIKEMAKYAFYPMDPNFYEKVKPGDMIVAGKNFGCGSSREQAPAVLKELGIKAIIAKSFSRLFFRNAITNGIIAIECPHAVDAISSGDRVKVDLENHKIFLGDKNYSFNELPEIMQKILKAGGLINYMKKLNK
jgi:3-isopropylmalate/(R)-2-methylmalate dehydratase small subunit